MSDSLAFAARSTPADGEDAEHDAGAGALSALREYLSATSRLRHPLAERYGVGVTEVIAMGQLAGGQLSARELADRLELTPRR